MTENYDLSKLRILLVEDNFHMRQLVREILHAFSVHGVDAVGDGKEALEALHTEDYDIVICDWEMKPVNGIDFVKQLRRDENSPNPFVPVIMLTGHMEQSSILEARDAGITEYLVKPVSANSIYKRLVSVIENVREFIRNDDYVGPDRRRKSSLAGNKGRRQDDAGEGAPGNDQAGEPASDEPAGEDDSGEAEEA